jgi:hypothetical protein
VFAALGPALLLLSTLTLCLMVFFCFDLQRVLLGEHNTDMAMLACLCHHLYNGEPRCCVSCGSRLVLGRVLRVWLVWCLVAVPSLHCAFPPQQTALRF